MSNAAQCVRIDAELASQKTADVKANLPDFPRARVSGSARLHKGVVELIQNPVVGLLYHRITLASCRFQPSQVEDRELAAAVAD